MTLRQEVYNQICIDLLLNYMSSDFDEINEEVWNKENEIMDALLTRLKQFYPYVSTKTDVNEFVYNIIEENWMSRIEDIEDGETLVEYIRDAATNMTTLIFDFLEGKEKMYRKYAAPLNDKEI